LFLLLVAGQALAQTPAITVRVKVTDLETGRPLDSVRVLLSNDKKNVRFTDKEGVVEFEKVFPGVDVIVNPEGYFAQSKKATSALSFRLVANGINNPPSVQAGPVQRYPELYTGSYAAYNGSELRRINPINVLDALAIADASFQVIKSNVNGDDPNALPTVQIRGAGNFPASASIASNSTALSTGVQLSPSSGDFIADGVMSSTRPLFLLNGVQVSLQQVVDMDFNRIEKVVLLKDAVATSPYGARGANGVVLIETRAVQKGDLHIRYSGTFENTNADLSTYHLMNTRGKLAIESEHGFYMNQPALLTQRQSSGINTNWLQVPLQNGLVNRHSLTVDGGDDNVEYGLNFAYNNAQGTMKGSERQTYALDLHVGVRSKAFFIRNDLSYSNTQSAASPFGRLSDYATLNPYWNPKDPHTGAYVRVLDQFHTTTVGGADSVVTVYNPAYNSALATENTTTYNRISNATNAAWMLGKGFSLNGMAAISYQADVNDFFLPPDNTAFINYTPSQFFLRGQYTQTNSSFLAAEGNLRLDYSRQFGLHHIQANAGISGMTTSSQASAVSVAGFSSDELANIGFGNGYSNSKPATGMIRDHWASAFAAVNYSYDQRYQLDLVASGDGSSQFGSSNPYAGYWAAGASWNVLNEHFLHQGGILNQLRLKATTGITGNQNFQSYLNGSTYNYLTSEQYILGGSNLGTRGVGLGAYLTGLGNTQLKSPTSTVQNAGIEGVWLNNRLITNASVYWQQSRGLVLPVYSPASTGLTNFSYYDNLGGIENKGIELSAQYAIVRDSRRSIYWNIFANGYHNVNRITRTSSEIDSLNSLSNSWAADQTRPQPLYEKGQSLTAIWAVRSAGVDPATGQEWFIKKDGTATHNWSAADKFALGDYMPAWQGSFGTSASVKGFSFAAFFHYEAGGKVYNQTLADYEENATLLNNVDSRARSGRWQGPGDAAPFKAVYLNGLEQSPTYATSRFIEKNDHIDCSSLVIGYSLPSLGGARLPFRNTGISIAANNALHFGNNDMQRGIYYPFNKTYSFTISTSFK
jgi:TonB-linked SusC/RagA family outer membrane protein